MLEEKSSSFQKRTLELGETETHLLAQNKTLQKISESQSKKIEELLNSISEAASEHEKEKNYFSNNETNLRMQIHRLRDVVKDMKVNFTFLPENVNRDLGWYRDGRVRRCKEAERTRRTAFWKRKKIRKRTSRIDKWKSEL